MSMAELPPDKRSMIKKMKQTELQLRKGHAEDCLETVRGAIIQLSWQFKNRIRGSEGAERTRSYDRIPCIGEDMVDSTFNL